MIAAIALLGTVAIAQEAPVQPTWNLEVAPIITTRCTSCHQDGGVGPFSLLTRDDVARRGTFILQVIDAGIMPPWLPDARGVQLVGDRAISKAERDVLAAWLGGGAPVGTGDPLVITPPSPMPMKADLMRGVHAELELPEETPPAYHTGEMDQHAFRLIMANPEPLRVRAVRATSNAPKTSRVMTLLVDPSGKVRELDQEDPLLGWRMGADVGYTPAGSHGMILLGGGPMRLPAGYHWDYPSRSEVALGVHYRPTGSIETLKESLEFELVPEGESTRPLRWLPVAVIGMDVPAGEVRTVRSSELVVPVDVDLVALTPRAHAICVDMRLEAEFPDGTRRVLLSIPDWDRHRRETYVLSETVRIPAGTRLHSSFSLDNRPSNPRNPDDPPIDMLRRRRAGILAVLLHAAAVDETDDGMLKSFGKTRLREAQRQR